MLLVTIHVTKIGTLLWNRVDQTPQPPDDDDGLIDMLDDAPTTSPNMYGEE